jgi:hypothetical protein
MAIVIGPVLARSGGYRFDLWIAGKGLNPGYPCRRIEDAHYARNTEIRTSGQDRASGAVVCETLEEFVAKTAKREMLAAA